MTQTATPSAPTLLAGEDTGRSDSDGITGIKMPTFVGTVAPGASVTIYDTDNSVLGAGVADSNGFYTIVLSQALNEGGHLITATATAPGESQSLHSSSLPLTTDSMAPDAPAAPILLATDDLGFSAEDGVTSKKVLEFTGLAEPNALVQLYNVDNSDTSNVLTSAVLASAIAGSDGSYTLTTKTLPDGDYKFEVTATDVAGNVAPITKDSAFTAVTVDSVAPPTPAAPTLTADTDTGVSHDDGLTNDTTPVVTGATEANATVTVYDNGLLVATGRANANGVYAIKTSTLGDGPRAITVKAEDVAGNISGASAPLNIFVDTATPTATITAPAVVEEAGSATFTVNFSTVIGSLTLADFALTTTGSASGVVQTLAGSGSQYTVTVDGLSGAGAVGLKFAGTPITDLAGNAVSLTSTQTHTVANTTQPNTVLVSSSATGVAGTGVDGSPSASGRIVAFGSTTGALVPAGATDGTENVFVKDMQTGAIVLVSTGVDGAAANGDSFGASLSSDGTTIAFASKATNLVAGGTAAGETNIYVAHLTEGADGPSIVPGSIQLISEGDGQQGEGTNAADQQLALPPILSNDGSTVVFDSSQILVAGDTSSFVNVFSENLATSALTLVSGGTGQNEYGYGTVTDPVTGDSYQALQPQPNTAPGSGGDFDSFVASLSADGQLIGYQSDATNLGGASIGDNALYPVTRSYIYNTATSATTNIDGTTIVDPGATQDISTINTEYPVLSPNGADVFFQLYQTSLTGFTINPLYEENLATQAITKVAVPSDLDNGIFIEDQSSSRGGGLALYLSNPGVYGNSPADEIVLVNTSSNTVTPLGQSFDPQLSTAGDAYTFVVEPSGASSDELYETTFGVSAGIAVIGSGDEVGAAALAQAVTAGGLTISGTTNAPGATAQVQLFGASATTSGLKSAAVSTTSDSSGHWTATLPIALLQTYGDGPYAAVVQIGTPTGASFFSVRDFIVDTQAPATPDAPALDAASDTTTAGDGSATNRDRPILTGTAEAAATITLYDSSSASPATPIGAAIADANGAYAITPTTGLINGRHSLDVTATDAAGNVSDASADVTFSVDTLAPAQPTLVLSPASDTGVSNSDGITKNATPTVTGIGEAGTTITLYDTDGLAVLGSTTVKGNGAWTLDSSSLSDGVHSLTVTDTDAAGNVSPSSAPLSVTIDTTPPSAPSISSVNGILVNGDLAPLVTVSGTAAPGATVSLHFDGGDDVLGTTTAAVDGDYSLESDPLPTGAHMLSVVATDLAGNDSQQSLQTAVTITDDAMPPPGTPANSPTLVGQLTDGPISGATIFADANGNGVKDTGEATAVTTTTGQYTLYNASGELISTGGVDSTTGLTPIGELTAPAGSTVITPLTTLLDSYAAEVGQTPSAAQPALLGALGLASTVDLTQFDPQSAAAGGDLSFLIASASVMDTAVNFADLIAAQTAASPSTAFAAVFKALAQQAETGTLNLVSVPTMQAVLANAAAIAVPGAVLPQTILQEGAAIAQTGNYDVSTAATPPSGISSQGFVNALEYVEQGEAAPQYAASANNPNSNVAGLYTYDLGEQVTNAESPVLAAPVLASSSDTGASDQDNITSLTNPVFKGNAPPGATVILVSGSFYAGGTVTIVGSAVADSAGHYSAQASLSAGLNTVIAMLAATGAPVANGTVVSTPSTLSATQLTSVVVGDLSQNTGLPLIQQSFYVADNADDAGQTSLYVTGEGSNIQEGATFTLTADNNPVPIGVAQGRSSAFGILTTPLSNGSHSLVVTETALDGETLQSLPMTVTVTSPGVLTMDAEATGPVAGGFIIPFNAGQTVSPDYEDTVHPAGATDAAGTATIPSVVGVPDQAGDTSAPIGQIDSGIELVGGQDRLTGLRLAADLGAPIGATVITPATTLLNQAENDAESPSYPLTSVNANFENARIDTALGLNTNVNLLTADPLAMAEAGDATLFLKNIELLDTVTLLLPFGDLPFGLIDNAEGSAPFEAFANNVPPAIVAPPIDFTSAATILSWLTTYFAHQNPALLTAYDASVLPGVAQIIAASNAAIEAHAQTASSVADALSYALAVEQVAIGDEAPAFVLAAEQPVGSSSTYQPVMQQDAEFAALQTAYTGAGLTAAITSALAQKVQVTNLAPETANTSAASVTFDLNFSAAVTGLTTGDFSVVGAAGLLGASVTSVRPVDGGDGAQYTVTVATGVGQGALTLDFTPTGIAGANGQPLTTGLFAAAQTYASPVENEATSYDDRVNGLAVGDFNGDGDPDVIATLEDGVTLFTGLGDGGFVAKPSIYPGGLNEATQILTGDFNGDGKLDVAVLTQASTDLFGAHPDYAMSVLLGNGNGTFQAPVLTDVGPNVVAIATADFNGDGKPDIAVLSQPTGGGDDTVQLYLGKGGGAFNQGPSLDIGGAGAALPGSLSAPQSLVAADLNGDGKPDLVVSTVTNTVNGQEYSTDVFLGDGDGAFTASAQIPLGLAESSSLASPNPAGVLIAVADLNGDGIPDIVVVPSNQSSLYDNAATIPTFSVLLGEGNGTFQPAISVPLPLPLYDASENESIAIGDVTGDGVPDLVIQNGAYGDIVAPGKGDGTFGAAYTTRSVSEEPLNSESSSFLPALALADVNGDGRLDLVSSSAGSAAASSAGAGIAVALNTAQTLLPASAVVTVNRSAVAQPALTQTSGAGALTHVGNAYTLDLGTLSQGATASAVLALANLAAAPADSFDGLFSTPSGGGFTLTGTNLPQAVAAGGSYTGLTFAADTATPGSYSETIIFAPRDKSATVTTTTVVPGTDQTNSTTTSADGANVAEELSPLTLTVNDVVAAAAPPQAAPTISGAAALQPDQDSATIDPFAAVVIADPGANQTQTVTVTTGAPANGVLSDPNAATDGSTISGATYSVSGVAAIVTTALQGLVFTPTNHQVAPGAAVTTGFSIAVTDTAGQTATDDTGSVVTTAAEDPPVIGGAQGGQAVTAGATLQPFAQATVADADLGALETTTLTLLVSGDATDATGALSGPGLTKTATGTYVLEQASPATEQALLRALVFTSATATSATTTFSLQVSDGTDTASDNTTSVVATVPPPQASPTISGAVAAQPDQDSATIDPFAAVVIADPGANQTQTVTVTTGSPANGVLSDPNAASDASVISGATYSVSGSAAAVTAALQGLVFTPTDHQVAPTSAVTTGFTISVTDTAGQTANDDTSSVVTTAVEDPPVIGGAQGGQAVTAGASLQPFAQATVTDPDLGAMEATTITLLASGSSTDATGVLSGPGLTKTATGVYALEQAAPSAEQALLRALVFTSTAESSTTASSATTTFDLQVSDGVDTASDTTTSVVATGVVTSVPVTVGLADDTGSSSTDGVTNDDELIGTAAANSTVTFTDNGVVLGSAVAGVSGAYSFTPTGLADGATELTASDASSSATLSFTLDTTAPSATSPSLTVASNAAATVIGLQASDNLSSIAQIGATITALPTDGVVALNGAAVVSGQVLTGAQLAQLTFAPTAGLANASSTLSYTVADPAGNIAKDMETLAVLGPTGSGVGDVHLETYDGLHYDFQADGDYVLTRSTVAGDTFQIQVHTDAYPRNHLASVITQAAADFGGDDVEFNLNGSVAINGVADTSLAAGAVQVMSGGTLSAFGDDDYRLVWSNGETLTVVNAGIYLNLATTVGPNDGPGSVQGLLGDLTGRANDLQLADGAVLPIPTNDAVLLGAYAQAWEVAPSQSLLTGAATASIQPTAFSPPSTMALTHATQPGQTLIGDLGLNGQAKTITGDLENLAGDTLINLGSADRIDFTNLPLANAISSWTASDTGGGVLSVSDGTQVTRLQIFGPNASASLHVFADQHGGTAVGVF